MPKFDCKSIRKANKYKKAFKLQLEKASIIIPERIRYAGYQPTRNRFAKVNWMTSLDFPESLLPLFLFLDNQFRPAALRLD